ncbi:MAG: dynamin family protein [Methylococcaceae bacterium]
MLWSLIQSKINWLLKLFGDNYLEKRRPPKSIQSFIKTKNLEHYLNGIFEKIDRNTINISVVAEVSSGKSTFLNALIFGKKILDAKMGETTAKIFKISYGESINSAELKEKVSKINISTKNEISKEEFSLEDIDVNDYIVNLTSDNEKLKKGIVLYDTPGFGTLNEKVMLKLIKESVNCSDAVILLLDISKGLKKDEAKFIKEALFYIKEDKRFIVLNKFDAAIDEDEDESEIQEQIDKVVIDTKDELVKISTSIDRSVLDEQTYYLSAIKALSGKSKNKPETLKLSRFPIFEESFWNRIVEAKKETFKDNVSHLVKEGAIVIDEVQRKIYNFKCIVDQTKCLVLNMEKVSQEIKEIITTQSAIFESINQEINQNVNIVWDEANLFTEHMNQFIAKTAKKSIDSMSNKEITKESLEKRYQEAIKLINKEFIKNNTIFIDRINSDIIKKERKVNEAIDILNMEMKNTKFKELQLQEIHKVESGEAKESKQLGLSNKANFSVEKNKIKANYTVSTTIDEEDSSVVAATLGGGMGAIIGSVVPVIGTGVGGAIGTAIGGMLGGFLGGNDKGEDELKTKMQEMKNKHQREMDIEKHKTSVAKAKMDFLYELRNTCTDHISDYIMEEKFLIDNNYRNMVSNIISSSHNAQNILMNMQTIIEDPNEQKQVIDENNKKIKELDIFCEKIEKCFIFQEKHLEKNKAMPSLIAEF